VAVFIFTRDLRLYDNTTLIHAMKTEGAVVPIFIFTPEQISRKNKYRSERAVQFMLECLDDLEKQIRKYGGKLHYFYGKPHRVIQSIGAENVYMNKDYTPYSRERANKLSKVCNLVELDDYKISNTKKYKVFSPFYKTAIKSRVAKPQSFHRFKFLKLSGHTNFNKEKFMKTINKLSVGGRSNGLKVLSKAHYSDMPLVPSSMLSPYLKFNVLSIREVYHYIKSKKIHRQLYWRDFYMQLELPNYKYTRKTSKRVFKKWKIGNTGVELIDTLMKELNETGYLHNRSRMIVANYLSRKCDWKLGERYFATQLTDYDPCSNNGGWRYVASVGPDSMPPYRSFNIERQKKKYYL